MNFKKLCAGQSKRLFLAFFSMLICANLYSQEPAPIRISPEEAVEMAFKSNLSLESSLTELETKRRASAYSWNQFIPNVTVAGLYTRDNHPTTNEVSGVAPVPIPLNPLFTNPLTGASFLPPDTPEFYGVVPYSTSVEGPQWRVSIPISVQLNLNAAMFENIRRLRLDYEGGLLSYENAKIQLERDVRKAYHNMLLLQENIALLRGSFENAERQVAIAQANYNAGLVPELQLIQARVARENMRPTIDQYESLLRISMAQFAMSLGLDINTSFEFVPVETNTDFIPIDIAEMIRQASANKPDIQQLRQSITMMESMRRAQVLGLTPILMIEWNTLPTYIPAPAKSWVDPRPGALTITLAWQLHSLIPFSSNFQGIRETDDLIRKTTLGLTQMIRATEIEIYNIILSLERTRISAEAQGETVALAEQSFHLTEEAYRAGLQDYFQVQSAEQSLHQARVQMLEQQFNYLNSLIDLEYAIGVPFGTLSGRR